MSIIVIGGSGAIGQAIIRQIRLRGVPVRSLDVRPHPDSSVDSRVVDIRDQDALRDACDGAEAVIHTASIVSQRADEYALLHDVNVRGTENVIAICQQLGVRALVYTSSIDVVFDGTSIVNGDESLPYARRHLDDYGTTKTLAEQAVLAANGQGGVATCALRVAGLYGPEDRHRFPRVVQPVLDSGTYTRIGDGRARFNHLFMDNAAHAHLLAADALTRESAVAGQVYFITDHEPGNFFDFFPPYLDALGISYRVRTLPYALMRSAAGVTGALSRLRPDGEVMLSRYAVEATCRDFWFNSKKAARDFGYQPIVSADEAFEKTAAWLKGWVGDYLRNKINSETR